MIKSIDMKFKLGLSVLAISLMAGLYATPLNAQELREGELEF